MKYLNNWDQTIPRLDVVDDFRSEKLEILRVQGSTFKFSFGDYIVKSLIGAIDPEMDSLDEVSVNVTVNGQSEKYWLTAFVIGVLCLAFAYLFF